MRVRRLIRRLGPASASGLITCVVPRRAPASPVRPVGVGSGDFGRASRPHRSPPWALSGLSGSSRVCSAAKCRERPGEHVVAPAGLRGLTMRPTFAFAMSCCSSTAALASISALPGAALASSTFCCTAALASSRTCSALACTASATFVGTWEAKRSGNRLLLRRLARARAAVVGRHVP